MLSGNSNSNPNHNSKYEVLSWRDIQYAVMKCADAVRFYDYKPERIVGVARGGLVPAVMLSHLLGVREVRSFQMGSYNSDNTQHALTITEGYTSEQVATWDNSETLFVDDLWDTGRTHSILQSIFPEATFTTLYSKVNPANPHTHKVVSFPGLPVPHDKWLVFPWEQLPRSTEMVEPGQGEGSDGDEPLQGEKPERVIFVFGSNLAGIHGAGSALEAKRNWGAIQGRGVGLQGNSFAIPTKNSNIREIRTLVQIAPHINCLLALARNQPTWEFRVVDIGCGLAGYSPQAVAPLFNGYPPNIKFLGELGKHAKAG